MLLSYVYSSLSHQSLEYHSRLLAFMSSSRDKHGPLPPRLAYVGQWNRENELISSKLTCWSRSALRDARAITCADYWNWWVWPVSLALSNYWNSKWRSFSLVFTSPYSPIPSLSFLFSPESSTQHLLPPLPMFIPVLSIIWRASFPIKPPWCYRCQRFHRHRNWRITKYLGSNCLIEDSVRIDPLELLAIEFLSQK